jgi:3-oxoacyl-[acyl-carrier protein] reductase
MELAGKSVLVTGASSGIGKAIAIAFAQKQARVLVHYGKNKSGGRETLDRVEKFSSGRLYQADLMDRDQIRALFEEVKQTNQTIDVLVTMPAMQGRETFRTIQYGTMSIKIFFFLRCT